MTPAVPNKGRLMKQREPAGPLTSVPTGSMALHQPRAGIRGSLVTSFTGCEKGKGLTTKPKEVTHVETMCCLSGSASTTQPGHPYPLKPGCSRELYGNTKAPGLGPPLPPPLLPWLFLTLNRQHRMHNWLPDDTSDLRFMCRWLCRQWEAPGSW